jgi:hypothetical protein
LTGDGGAMNFSEPLLVTSTLMLLPLAPAAVLYLVLSPKRTKVDGDSVNKVDGEYKLGPYVRFNVLGHPQPMSYYYGPDFIYSQLKQGHLQQLSLEQESIKDRQAWLVEVPVGLKDSNNVPLKPTTENYNKSELSWNLVLPSHPQIQFSFGRSQQWQVSHRQI